MKVTTPGLTEKLTKPHMVRLAASDSARLAKHAVRLTLEPVDLIRDAAIAELDRLDLDEQRKEFKRLSEAGIDLKALVDYAIGRKLAEEAQTNLPGMFATKA